MWRLYFTLYFGGIWLIGLAYWLSVQRPPERAVVTSRDAANFAADVEAWLRSEGF